jgi:hypothetical protein
MSVLASTSSNLTAHLPDGCDFDDFRLLACDTVQSDRNYQNFGGTCFFHLHGNKYDEHGKTMLL